MTRIATCILISSTPLAHCSPHLKRSYQFSGPEYVRSQDAKFLFPFIGRKLSFGFHGRNNSSQIKVQAGESAASFLQSFGDALGLGKDRNRDAERAQMIHELFTHVDEETYDRLLEEDFTIKNAFNRSKGVKQSKIEWMNFIFSTLKPAIPDFNWAPFEGRFGGQVDNEGWCLCSVEATGHHTNADLELEGLPALPASGAHFCLPQQLVKVKVDLPKRRIKAIEVVPKHGASVADLYAALGGRLPEGSLDEREGRRGAEA